MQEHKNKIIELLNNPILLFSEINPVILQNIETADESELIATIDFLQKAIIEKQENLQNAQTNLEALLATTFSGNKV